MPFTAKAFNAMSEREVPEGNNAQINLRERRGIDVRSAEHGARRTENGARRTEYGARSTEHGARSTERGARSTEHGARSAEEHQYERLHLS